MRPAVRLAAVAASAAALFAVGAAQERGYRGSGQAVRTRGAPITPEEARRFQEESQARDRFVGLSEQYARLRAEGMSAEDLREASDRLEAQVALLRARSALREAESLVKTAATLPEVGSLEEEAKQLSDLIGRLARAAEALERRKSPEADVDSTEREPMIDEEAIERIEERFDSGGANDSFPPYTEPPIEIEEQRVEPPRSVEPEQP